MIDSIKHNNPHLSRLAMVLIFLVIRMIPVTATEVPIDYYKLANGLRVVLAQDKSAPIVGIGVYYKIGFRTEPKNRTGFAHLFEHMMFQGSGNLGKMEFIQLIEKNGGMLNGSTRFDFTNYYEIVPSNQLEPMLWAEADRMKGLDVSQANLTNQQGVVKNEVKVGVLNQPYGGFPWLDLPQAANENWFNAHNFYGDLRDLDSANVDDVNNFFKTYYSPNNAVLVITGDFETAQAKEWVSKYFAKIPMVTLPPEPDISEPKQQKEKRKVKEDKLASKPAIAIGYKAPPQNTPEYFAMGLIDQIMLKGNDARFNQRLVQEKGFTDEVSGGINYQLGHMFDVSGPTLWMFQLTYDSSVSAEKIINEIDSAIAELVNKISPADLELAIVKQRSWLYTEMGDFYGLGKLNLLAAFALFDDDPSKINNLEKSFNSVTLELIKKTASEYLVPTNRTVLIIDPKATNQ